MRVRESRLGNMMEIKVVERQDCTMGEAFSK
jgi:hypothetical protein